MENRAALIFLCLLVEQAPWGAAGCPTVSIFQSTIEMVLKDIGEALDQLVLPGLNCTDSSCQPPAIEDTFGEGSEPLTAQHLSSAKCILLELADKIQGLSEKLLKSAQVLQDLREMLLTEPACDRPVHLNCTLPQTNTLMTHANAKCLLQSLKKRLRGALAGFRSAV